MTDNTPTGTDEAHPHPHTAEELAELDRIARQIDIDAPAERVWDLIARPGWYVNDGAVDPDPDLHYEDDVAVLRHPTLGEFRFRTVTLDKPRYAAFRWIGTPFRNESAPSTLLEFWIDERDGGGVTLRVVESGFSSLSEDPATWLKQREGNVKGWRIELSAAKTYAERGAGSGTGSGTDAGTDAGTGTADADGTADRTERR
ncbi:ATPase [Streptomyces sp. NPDC058045]|uniref:ATPase n=1 Tax=Streptomyces sp. NPDC058045 TaxID=3346311 RepID=UPI0036E7903D